MRRTKAAALVAVVGTLIGSSAFADRFYLTEDRLIEGLLVREDTATVTFQLDGAGMWTLSKHSLHRVEKENAGAYWLRVGERRALHNRFEEAREAFGHAAQDPETERQATRRLKDLELLEVSARQPRIIVTESGGPAPDPGASPASGENLLEIRTEDDPVATTPAPSRKAEPSAQAPETAPAEQTLAKVLPEKDAPPPKRKSAGSREARQPREYSELIRDHCRRHGVDPLLVNAIIAVESRWNPNAISRSGARGLMQLMPETAAMLGVRDAHDPEDNIRAGIRYLGELNREFGHLDWPERQIQVVAAYNAGPNRLREVGDYRKIPQTLRYTRKVMAAYDALREQKNAEVALLDRKPSF